MVKRFFKVHKEKLNKVYKHLFPIMNNKKYNLFKNLPFRNTANTSLQMKQHKMLNYTEVNYSDCKCNVRF